jgi:succinyl-CoA synthetase beta subunit
VKAILVNIFGGIMQLRHRSPTASSPRRAKCSLQVPLVVRLEGTNVRAGQADPRRERACRSSPPTTWPTPAQKVVAAAVEGRPSR